MLYEQEIRFCHDDKQRDNRLVQDGLVPVASVIGHPLCVAAEDGERVRAELAAAIAAGQRVRLSFAGVEDLSAAFLDAAVGRLYEEFPERHLERYLLEPVSASRDDLGLYHRVIEMAKDYYQNPRPYHEAYLEALGDG